MALIVRPANILSPDELLDKALKLISQGITTLVIVNKGKYEGIVTDRTIRSLQHEPKRKISSLIWHAPTIKKDMTLEEMCELFLHGYRELPVVENGTVVGTLKHTDILRLLLEKGRIPRKRVTEVSKEIIKIERNTNVAQAAAKMRREGIHHLAVVENEKIVGVISSADIIPFLKKAKERLPFVRERIGLESIELKTVVVPEIKSIRESAFLTEAAEKMIEEDITMLIVTNGTTKIVHAFDVMRASLPKAELPLEIVGLDEEEKELRGEIRAECLTTLRKIQKIMPIENARLTIKKFSKSGERHKYSLRFMVSGKHFFDVDASHWNLFNALHYVLREVERLAVREKEKGKTAKKKRGWRARLMKGEISRGGI